MKAQYDELLREVELCIPYDDATPLLVWADWLDDNPYHDDARGNASTHIRLLVDERVFPIYRKEEDRIWWDGVIRVFGIQDPARAEQISKWIDCLCCRNYSIHYGSSIVSVDNVSLAQEPVSSADRPRRDRADIGFLWHRLSLAMLDLSSYVDCFGGLPVVDNPIPKNKGRGLSK